MNVLRKILILDSNLVVSAFLNPRGVAAQALDIGLEYFDLACSRETLTELIDVLKRDKFDTYLSKSERAERAETYAQSVMFFDVIISVADCRDPKDNKFLALAITAQARAVVSGDKRDLLSMKAYHGIDIIGLREFVDNYEQYM
jgi:uncharacterized protein